MGNREDLLSAAQRCIVERGLGATTARDIATAADTSLAAIGYHFGGKDALLTEALVALIGTGVGDAIDAALAAHAGTRPPLAGFVATWRQLIASFDDLRPSLLASLENLVAAHRHPELLTKLAEAQRLAIREMADGFAAEAGTDASTAAAVGELYYVLLNGLVLMWFVDPAALPSPETLGQALQVLADGATASG